MPIFATTTRREFLALTLALAAGGSRAQGFPDPRRPIRIIIPAPPGGPADLMGRAVAQYLSGELNDTPVLVESKPGGASVPAALAVARAAPDGHTLLLTINTTHTQVPHMFGKRPYEPLEEFTPVTQMHHSSSVLAAHPSLPVGDLKELVAYSKANGPVPTGSSSPGTNSHLYLEMLNEAGANLNHVPYKGSAPAVQDLVGGFIKVLFDSPATTLPHVREKRLKALAVTGTTRLAALPDVKTGREQGFPALDITGWMGFFAPAGMPPAVLERLNRALVAAIRRPEIRARFEPLSINLTGTTAAEFAAIVRADYETWGRIIRRIGLKLD